MDAEVKGIKGNKLDYYDPDNSCIDKVLAGGPGIPITIALLYMELARRVGFPMVGVNLPAHFMIRPVVGDMEVLVDVFNEVSLGVRSGSRVAHASPDRYSKHTHRWSRCVSRGG
jgi:regulator of sirC expression with transglutaminase-like and TPR domain